MKLASVGSIIHYLESNLPDVGVNEVGLLLVPTEEVTDHFATLNTIVSMYVCRGIR